LLVPARVRDARAVATLERIDITDPVLEAKVFQDDGTVVDSVTARVVLVDISLGDGDRIGDVV